MVYNIRASFRQLFYRRHFESWFHADGRDPRYDYEMSPRHGMRRAYCRRRYCADASKYALNSMP